MCLTFLNPTVFVYSSLSHSLALSHSHSLACLFSFISICVFLRVWKRSLQSSSLFPSSQRDHLSPLETWPTGSGSLHWPTLPKKSSLGQGTAKLKCCVCRCRCCTLPPPAPCPIPPAAVPPMAALLAKFSGWSWVARNYVVAFDAAAARAHGLGDRKELTASHKQDSSCTHYSQDLQRTLPGKSFRHPL